MRYALLLSIVLVFTACKDDGTGLFEGPYEEKHTGFAANDLLSASKFNSLNVEILYMPGMQPTSSAVSHLSNFLNARLNKPQGINIIQREIPSGNESTYSINDLIETEEERRNEYNDGGRIAVSFLFVDADYSENSGNGKVLGVAYRSTSMCLFGSTIREFSGGTLEPSRATLESSVMTHEMGHILGLVNNGTELQSNHQDAAHGAHCDVEDCLMYYTAESSASIGNLTGGNIPQLDAQCIADLRANGGK